MRISRKTERTFLIIVGGIFLLSLAGLIIALWLRYDPFHLLANRAATRTAVFNLTPSSTPTRTLTPTFTSTNTLTPTRTVTLTPLPSATGTPSLTPTAFTYDQGVFERRFFFKPLYYGKVNRLVAADDGNFWFDSNKAVGYFNPVSRKLTQIMISDPVMAILKEGKVWMFSPTGTSIQIWDGTNLVDFGADQGWLLGSGYGEPSPLPVQLSFDAAGNAWVTNWYDVRRLKENRWQIFTTAEMKIEIPYRKTFATSFMIAHSKKSTKTWLTACDWNGDAPLGGSGLRLFEGNTWSDVEIDLPAGCVTQMQTDRAGNLWLGLNGKLIRYNEDSAKLNVFNPPELDQQQFLGFSHGSVIEITPVDDGSLWVLFELCGSPGCGTRQVRYHLVKDEWQPEVLDSQVRAPLFLIDHENNPWSFQPGEISRFENGQFVPVARLDWVGADIAADGSLWVVTQDISGDLTLWQTQP